MILLGIDPGTRISGFVIFKKELNRIHLLDCGLLQLDASLPLPNRVEAFFNFFNEKIITYGVTDLALETSFLGKNAANFLKLGYLRGALYILISRYKLSLHEFAPTKIKQSITGFGGAAKEQVARVVMRLFPGITLPSHFDLTDAFAVALCCLWSSNYSVR